MTTCGALITVTACDRAPPTRPGGDDEWGSLAAGAGVTVEYVDRDAAPAATVGADAAAGAVGVAAFFGEPALEPLTVRLYPDRASLTESWRATWAGPAFQPECWMIGSATTRVVSLLSPAVWTAEACEHDPGDAAHVREVLTHEVVHVLHARLAGGALAAAAERWLYEGLGVYASGQLDDAARARVRAQLTSGGLAPAHFADLWASRVPYEASGSFVAYLDRTLGRETLRRLMRAGDAVAVRALLGAGEAELLAGWAREQRE